MDKVEIVNAKETNQPKENFEAFYRQKPNRKLFRSVHFFVWWYNLFDDEKIKQKRIERNLKYDKINSDRVLKAEKKNEERVKKGKKPKTPKLKDKSSLLLVESIRDIGEPAVILDSSLTERTRIQLVKFLFSKGYFDNKVTDTVTYTKDNKATVKFILYPDKPYMVNKITYLMEDEKLGAMILKDTINTLLKVGMQYDRDKLQEEQQRITDFALNNGYFYFEKAYVDFYVDSVKKDHIVSIKTNLKKYAKAYSSSNDSLIYVNHPRMKVENVYIITEATYGDVKEAKFTDTLKTKKEGTVFLLNKELAYRQPIIINNTDIYRGQWFRKDTSEQTYKQLLGLGIFKNVTIKFLKNDNYSSRLDCYIICNPLLKQSLTAETEGTNTSGNLGIDGSVVYQNKNFFRGGELIELKLQAAILAQRQLSNDTTTIVNSVEDAIDLNRLQRTFNTIQFGPEFTFSVPRAFFPFSLLPFKKDMLPRTFVKTSLNYQASPQFNRVITNINYGFSFLSNKGRIRHNFIPFEAYLVRAKLSDKYLSDLNALNDAFLINSFSDHITTLSKYGVTYTSKENSNTSRKTVHYIRATLSSSGNILRQYFKSTGAASDTAGRYLLFGIPFAQFVKGDIDYRIYIPVRTKSRLVYRVAGGIGKPLQNLGVLPYEQSYFSGGPNSVRAWRARTLGPGGYDPSNSATRYDKIGDILLEGNIEYRFHIIKSFNGALFVDAGNVWRLNKDETKPNAEFVVPNFADQIAIGGGMGIRWDLSFFVLRFDLAAPLKDPKYPIGDRWTFDKQPWKQLVANFGIGYPF